MRLTIYNAQGVVIAGYKFFYAKFNRKTRTYEIHEKPVVLEIVIPGRDAIILATKSVKENRISGISTDHVFVLEIDNVLKKGWRLLDAKSKVVHEIGTLFTNGLVGDPVLPKHVQGSRQSYQRIASQTPSVAHYYGHALDGGSPGFYRAKVRAPAAPTLLKKRVLNTSWAALKKQ